MKKILLFIFSLLTLSLSAQDIKFDVLSNAGGRISNVNSASFTFGQTFVGTKTNGTNSIRQGFQQPSFMMSVPGCMDTLALNYDSLATINDSSCTYQMTYVPDDNFEQALINLGYDNILDDSVITAHINIVTHLDVHNNSISDLTGIEDFTALTNLECHTNQLTSLDVSQNTALTSLGCGYNSQLTSLDVSYNTALTHLYCHDAQLTSLDLSANTALTYLACYSNQLTSLDVRNGNNTNFTSFMGTGFLAVNNPNLSCIDVDDANWSAANWLSIDPASSFSTNCATAVFGCTDTTACNYNLSANTDDGSCNYNSASYDTLVSSISIVWNGLILTTSGDYSVTLINSVGCDSIVNLNLTVTTTGISDIANSKSNLVKITDMLGQETPYRRNTPLFYIYDDGTVEKRIVIE